MINSQIKMLADNPDQWALLLGAAFPNSSNFFLVRCMHGCIKLSLQCVLLRSIDTKQSQNAQNMFTCILTACYLLALPELAVASPDAVLCSVFSCISSNNQCSAVFACLQSYVIARAFMMNLFRLIMPRE
jgi:hypothetical protein